MVITINCDNVEQAIEILEELKGDPAFIWDIAECISGDVINMTHDKSGKCVTVEI